MNEMFWIRLVAATLATLGFSIFFFVHPRRLFPAVLGGCISCAIYLLANHFWGGELLPNFVAAAVAAVYAEMCARITRVPVTVYLLPGVIALAPGGALYNTVFHLANEQYTEALIYGRTTLQISLGIAGGVAIGSMLGVLLRAYKRARRKTNP